MTTARPDTAEPSAATVAETLLVNFVRDEGRELCLDHRRVQRLLAQADPERSLHAVLIHIAVREGVAADLARDESPTVTAMAFERFVRRLVDQAGLAKDHAAWAVDAWARALGRQPPESGPRFRGAPVRQKVSHLPASRAVAAPRDLVGHRNRLTGLAFRPDGRRLVTCSVDRTVRTWDVRTGAPLRVLYGGHRDWVRAVAWSSDGGHLASVGDDGGVRIWDADTGERQHRLLGHDGPVLSVRYSPDGRLLVSGGRDGRVCLWEVDGLHEAGVFGPFDEAVTSLAFEPAGHWLAIALKDGVEVWNMDQRGPVHRLPAAGTRVVVAAGPDDGLVVADDEGCTSFNALTGRERVRFSGHVGPVRAVALHPNGKSLATGGSDQTIRVWHTAVGVESWRFEPNLVPSALAFDPQGQLAMAFEDGTAKLVELIRAGGDSARPGVPS